MFCFSIYTSTFVLFKSPVFPDLQGNGDVFRRNTEFLQYYLMPDFIAVFLSQNESYCLLRLVSSAGFGNKITASARVSYSRVFPGKAQTGLVSFSPHCPFLLSFCF